MLKRQSYFKLSPTGNYGNNHHLKIKKRWKIPSKGSPPSPPDLQCLEIWREGDGWCGLGCCTPEQRRECVAGIADYHKI